MRELSAYARILFERKISTQATTLADGYYSEELYTAAEMLMTVILTDEQKNQVTNEDNFFDLSSNFPPW